MRLYFVTDLHSSQVCFLKFLSAPKVYKVDKLVLGGDLTGKSVTPIIEGSGSYTSEFMGINSAFTSHEELEQFKKKVRDTGSYPVVMSKEEHVALKNDSERLDKLFRREVTRTLQEWIIIAEERLKETKIEVYATGGNDDEPYVDEVFTNSSRIQLVDNKVVDIGDGYEMMGCSHANITPWKCPRDITEEKFREVLSRLTGQVKNMDRCIFNVHCPPKDSTLDTCPKLDDSVWPPKLVTIGGDVVYFGAGSEAVREAIEKHQPLLGLHGHIHESRNSTKIGRTSCINPGSEYTEGVLKGAIIEIEEDKVKRSQFTAG